VRGDSDCDRGDIRLSATNTAIATSSRTCLPRAPPRSSPTRRSCGRCRRRTTGDRAPAADMAAPELAVASPADLGARGPGPRLTTPEARAPSSREGPVGPAWRDGRCAFGAAALSPTRGAPPEGTSSESKPSARGPPERTGARSAYRPRGSPVVRARRSPWPRAPTSQRSRERPGARARRAGPRRYPEARRRACPREHGARALATGVRRCRASTVPRASARRCAARGGPSRRAPRSPARASPAGGAASGRVRPRQSSSPLDRRL
jgi:hypothetical protein